jgi:FkbM family methyltransferase
MHRIAGCLIRGRTMSGDKLLNFNYEGVAFPFVIDEAEAIISQTVESTGVWEANQLSLYDTIIPENGVFIDVGANVGVNSIFAHKTRPNARVIAVEPEPRNFARLSQNCSSFPIELHNVAIADHQGSIGFAGTGTNAHIASDGEQRVACDTLDNFTASLGVGTIDLIKIDVEGYTDVVLSKAEETLSRTRIGIIEFSYGDIVSRLRALDQPATAALEHSEKLFDRIRQHFAYLHYISRGEGLVRLDSSADLFEIMFSEASVGDVLAAKEPMPSISAIAFAFRNILELKRQNHFRLLELEELRARSNRQLARESQA